MKEREVIFCGIASRKRTLHLADCLTWDENDRAELIGGEIVRIAPTSRVHKNQWGAVPAACQLSRGEKV